MAKFIATLLLVMFYLSLALAAGEDAVPRVCQLSTKLTCKLGSGGECADYCKAHISPVTPFKSDCLVSVPENVTYCNCDYPC